MSTFTKRDRRNRGAALIIIVFFFIMISIAIIQSATIGAISQLRTYRALAASKYAYVAAEAGAEDIFYRAVTGLEIPTSEIIELNDATSTVSVISAGDRIEIYSAGEADSRVRKLYLDIQKIVKINFPYGAQVGEGGATLKQGAIINGVGLATGDLLSNGEIVGANGVRVTGNAISSSGIIADSLASSTACTSDVELGKTNPFIDYAQSFVMGGTDPDQLARVSLYLKRVSNPNDAKIRIVADNGGVPATTALATQDVDYTLVGTNYAWVDILFTSPATLTPGSTYWIVLDSGQSSTKYWYWCRSNTDDYVSGAPKYKQDWSTAGAWTDVTGDLTFHVYFGAGVSKISQVNVSGTAKADTLTAMTVDGDAYYQTISGSTVAGNDCDPAVTPPCYPGSPTPPYVPLPISTTTIARWKLDAVDGGTINGNCGTGGDTECNTFPLTLGPKKITGNFDIGGGQTLNVNGTLHIVGNLNIGAGGGVGTVRCSVAYQANSCTVIVDGYIRVRGGSILAGSGTAGSFIMLLSTKQGCLGSGGSGCSTNDSAIALENSVSGAIFYATDSMIDVSNLANVSSIVAYKLQLQNNTTVSYDDALTAVSFVPSATIVTGEWHAQRWGEH